MASNNLQDRQKSVSWGSLDTSNISYDHNSTKNKHSLIENAYESHGSTSPRIRQSPSRTDSGSPDSDNADSRATLRRSNGNKSVTLTSPHAWHPTGYMYRFTILGLVAYLLMAGYFSDETIGATASELREQMNLTPKEIGWIYSASYGPNIIMIFIGGILVDKLGVRLMSLIYTTLVVAGLAIFALSNSLWGKIIGRVVFGAGFEPLEVCSDAIVMRWYSSTRVDARDGRRYKVGAPSIPLAFSVLFSVGIFGQFLSLNVLPSVLAAFHKNLTHVYLLVTFIGVTALLFNIVFAVMDFIGSRTLDLENTVSESVSFRVLSQFPLAYWLLMGVCVFGYSCQYVFMIYASDYIHEKWGYNDIQSGNWASMIYVFAIILSPVVGYFVERRGQALTLMGIGCLSFAIGCIIMGMIPPTYLPAVPLVFMGIAYSLVPATVWASISDVIPDPLAGTGFGVMTAIMSFTYLIIPSGVGAIHDFWNSYEYMNFAFALCALISFGGVLLIAKIEPDLNVPARARRKDLASYNVVAREVDSDDEEKQDLSPRSGVQKHQDEFDLIRDRYQPPARARAQPRKLDETELLTVTEEDDHFDEDEETSRGFSTSVIPDSWLTLNRRVGETMPSSLPSDSYLRDQTQF